MHQHETPRRRKLQSKPGNPVQAGIIRFCTDHGRPIPDLGILPKRFTLYSPLLLLPANFVDQDARWRIFFTSLDASDRRSLFASIAGAFKGQCVTHIAINAPIPLATSEGTDENVMRSPSGLIPLYGDFGPCTLLEKNSATNQPTQEDFDDAFWVSTTQHKGIVQCWAPRWTMFSRGNVGEKARILQEDTRPFPGLSEQEIKQDLSGIDVVDFYVGIGYFASCYLSRGVRRVWGWDLNPWSIEGLRRGCKANGWRCLTLTVDPGGNLSMQLDQLVEQLVAAEQEQKTIRCIAFLGDNKWAAQTLLGLRKHWKARLGELEQSVRHANLGLLPSSRSSWEDALRLLDESRGGWLHIHENVDVKDIEGREVELAQELQRLTHLHHHAEWTVSCTHVERVKTYAPGVMHCVFDVEIAPPFEMGTSSNV